MSGGPATPAPDGRAAGRSGGRRPWGGRRPAGALPGLLAAASLIAGITALARVVGFGRVFVFNGTVGAGCTGAAYAAANQLPNVLFEVAAGGALAGAVVPVLAGLRTSGRDADADRTASALLTWVLLVLVPLSLLLAALAWPLGRLLLAGSPTAAACGPAVTDLAARMVLVFAPQVALYGVGTVLTGVLQARHRFAWPALAPLLSSAVVIVAYLLFGALGGGPGGDPARLPGRGAELVLSVGTTLGVVALSLPLLLPVRRAGVRLRLTRRFPDGALAALRGPALAGIAALLAQQAAVLVTVVLTARIGGAGALNAVQYAQAVYLLPYAVLAVPLATAAFPRLAEHAAAGRRDALADQVAAGARSAAVLGLLGAGLLVATAPAVQALFQALDVAGGGALDSLAEGLAWFAVGLPGWALVAHLTRALYAAGRPRPAAEAQATGWAVAALGSVLGAVALHDLGVPGVRATLVAIAASTSAGMLLAAAFLARAVRAAAGARAFAGTRRTALAAGAGALAAGVVGFPVAALATPQRPSVPGALGAGVLAALVALACTAVAWWWLEPAPPGHAAGRAADPGEPRVLLVRATSDGGTGRHVAALAAWLHGHGVPVRVAAPASPDAGRAAPADPDAAGAAPADPDAAGAAPADPDAVPAVALDVTDRPRPLRDLRAVLRLRSLAARADVVHAHGLRAGALAVLAVRSRRHRSRLVVTVHNALTGLDAGRVTTAVHAVLARTVALGADRVLAVSGDVAAELRRLGARHVDRALVPAPPRGAPVTPPDAVRAALGLGPGAVLAVTVGRLAPQKGLDTLLDATALLRATPVRAVIAGDGPLEHHLAGRIAREVLPVTLLGRRDDVPDLLAAADVVVVPSRWEGQPLIVQEALRAGAAIVATDAGGTREVAGDGALLVPPGDPAALARAVAELISDEGHMITLRESAAARAARLPTDDDAGWQVLGTYRDVVGEVPPRPNGPAAGGPPRRPDRLEARGAADS